MAGRGRRSLAKKNLAEEGEKAGGLLALIIRSYPHLAIASLLGRGTKWRESGGIGYAIGYFEMY